MISVIVFDLDETLVTSPGLAPLWMSVCGRHGLPEDVIGRAWSASRGLSLWGQLDAAGVTDPELQDRIVAEFWAGYDYSSAAPLPHAPETVRTLAENGVIMHLSTGSDPDVARGVLARHDLDSFFTTINGSTRAHPKGPAHIAAIAQAEDLAVEQLAPQAAFVGDGQFDMLYGKEAGFAHRIGISAGDEQRGAQLLEAGATALAADLSECLTVLHKHLWSSPCLVRKASGRSRRGR